MILAILNEQRAQLKAMKEFARAHPITLTELQRLAARDPALDPIHRHPEECYVKLPVGFEVGLTYELQQRPCWHLSMSAELTGRYPRPEAVTLVCGATDRPGARLGGMAFGAGCGIEAGHLSSGAKDSGLAGRGRTGAREASSLISDPRLSRARAEVSERCGVENRRHAAWAEQPVGLRLPPGQPSPRNGDDPQRRRNT